MSQLNELISFDVNKLYEHWDPQQKQENISSDKVAFYRRKIAHGETLEPIIIDGLSDKTDQNGIPYIRTADGRHRLTACHEMGVKSIQALHTPAAVEASHLLEIVN